jgi:KaiC/GvpD/RAD55 family RecA-like ATPase
MDAEYGVRLPDYNDEGLAAYIEKVKRLVAKLHWTVTLECKIGLFSFYKINMYRDLKGNAANILANRNVRLLLGESLTNDNIANVNRGGSHVADPLIELHSVVDADSSQIEAIEMAKSGKSFVLQGPPGTGKSQTITNIIAECLSDGKRVLFVSEKLAALNVVYDKLKQAGLSEFCLEIHSYNANKKDVIADIYHTLRTDKSAISSKADGEIEVKKRSKRQLDAYEFELHKQRPVIDKSLYQMYDSVSALRSVPDVDWVVPQIATKGDEYLKETSWLLEQYVDYIPSIGYDYRKNFWYGYINQDSSYQTKLEVKSNIEAVVSLLQKLTPLLREVSEKYGINCSSIGDAYKWHKFFKIVASSRLISPSLLYRENFEAVNSALKNLQAQSTDILSLRSRLDKVFYRNIYKIDGVDYYQKINQGLQQPFVKVW